jgi:hypothetical protein
MPSPDHDAWRFINTFAPWFSAFGTLLAVITSLYFARRDKRIRLEISAGHRLIVTQGIPAPHPEYLNIRVVNVGHREAQITNIGWNVGILKKRHAIQTTIPNGISSQLPIRLRDGEAADYYIPFNDHSQWARNFKEEMLAPFPRLRVHFVRIWVLTSLGSKFDSKIEKGLRGKLLEV